MDQTEFNYLLDELRTIRKENMSREAGQNEKLEKILVQTTKTNGRVDSLMQFRDNVIQTIDGLKKTQDTNNGRDKMLGFVIGTVVTIGIAILSWMLSNHYK